MPGYQPLLPFGPVRNHSLFSNHWLDHRLTLEPEWAELRPQAESTLERLAAIWAEQRGRVEQYGDEPGLEQAFIQPVLQALGWKIKYQTFLRGRKPDYALFLDDAAFDRALNAGRQEPAFWEHPRLLADSKARHVGPDRPSVVNNHREYPPEQIEWYLDKSRLEFAILTDASGASSRAPSSPTGFAATSSLGKGTCTHVSASRTRVLIDPEHDPLLVIARNGYMAAPADKYEFKLVEVVVAGLTRQHVRV